MPGEPGEPLRSDNAERRGAVNECGDPGCAGVAEFDKYSSEQHARIEVRVPNQKYLEGDVDCGRKFADDAKLQDHVARRHKVS